jgi:hypothetical protein
MEKNYFIILLVLGFFSCKKEASNSNYNSHREVDGS